jgi:ornithine cyclodeaminase/alanine dehydrogenase-like protein (mu-crystallin family)
MSDRARVRRTRYLSEADVSALLPSVPEQIDVVADALRQVAERRAHQPPKIALPAGADGRFFHLMPAVFRAGGGQVAGAKWISGGGGLPIDGLVILEDARGATRGLLAAAGLTAARTAAVSGAAIRVARHGLGAVSRVAFVGGGVQAHSHREMLAAEHPTASVLFLTRRRASELPLRAGDRVAENVEEALRDAELLITAAAFGTEARALPLGLLAPDATIIAIDYATSIRGEDLALLRAHRPVRLMTDSAEQFNATRVAGKLDGWPEISEEIGADGGAVFAGTTIVNHLGIAACDLLLADLLLARAEERGIGTLLG